MGTTANGMPYPEGTDKVVDGDNAIRALAEAIPPGILAEAVGPATQQDVAANNVIVASVTVPVVTGKRYVVSGGVKGNRISATGYAILGLMAAGAEIWRMQGASTDVIAVNAPIAASGRKVYTAASTGNVTFATFVSANTPGAVRVTPNSAIILVEQISGV